MPCSSVPSHIVAGKQPRYGQYSMILSSRPSASPAFPGLVGLRLGMENLTIDGMATPPSGHLLQILSRLRGLD